MRSPLLVTIVVACLAVPLSPVHAQPGEGYGRANAQLETTTGADEELPVTLDYDLWVPDGASPADPRPAMVVAHGFGNTKDVNEVITLAAFFAGRGYVVITSSHMGFGGSSGCVALDAIDTDSRNVTRLIDVLAARDDVLEDSPGDPVVGMVGGSYGGGHQGGVAALDPRLDAMSPGRTWNSLQYSLVPNNLIGDGGLHDLEHYEQGVFKATWSSLFFGVGTSQPASGGGGCDPVTQQTLYPGQPSCPGFEPVVCGIFANLRTTGDVTDEQRQTVARSSITNHIEGVDIPVLLTQGQSDTLFTLVEAASTLAQLRDRGRRDVQLIFNDGGHGYQPLPGEGEPYSGAFDDTPESQAIFADTYFARRFAAFFDFHLLGLGHPGPVFAYHPAWGAPDAEGAISYVESGDVPDAVGVDYLLDDAGLVPVNPSGGASPAIAAASFSATLLAPGQGGPFAHSETPNFSGQGQPGSGRSPNEIEGQHVALDSPPFTAPATVIGFPTVTLDVSNSNGQDAVLFTKLYDVAPDGSATLIRRLVAASRIPAERMPGVVDLRVPGVVHRFETGHSARLVIATTDDSYRNATASDQITLSTDETGVARLRLPLSGGDQVTRIAGADRVATAVELSEFAFPTAADAVLVSADDFPDALSAGPLAAALGGPLLLTPGGVLDQRVLDDLRRLGTIRVTVVGGPASVDPAVTEALGDAGFEVVRVGGASRYETAALVGGAVAEIRAEGLRTVVLATGRDFADALSAGGLAATTGGAVLLVDPGQTGHARAAVADLLDASGEIVVAGGESAVSSALLSEFGDVERAAGEDRFATGVALADRAVGAGAAADPILLASGTTFADALAAVPAAHAAGGLVLIVPPTEFSAASTTAAWLARHRDTISTGYLVGGTAVLPASVATAAERQIGPVSDGGGS